MLSTLKNDSMRYIPGACCAGKSAAVQYKNTQIRQSGKIASAATQVLKYSLAENVLFFRNL